MATAPDPFRLAIPPGVTDGIAGVGLARPVAARSEDVARRLMTQFVQMARKTGFEIAAHLLENPAVGRIAPNLSGMNAGWMIEGEACKLAESASERPTAHKAIIASSDIMQFFITVALWVIGRYVHTLKLGTNKVFSQDAREPSVRQKLSFRKGLGSAN